MRQRLGRQLVNRQDSPCQPASPASLRRPAALGHSEQLGVLHRQSTGPSTRRSAHRSARRSLFGCSAFAPTACKAPVAVAHRYARGSSQPPRTPPAKASRSPRTFSQGTPAVAALRQAYARLAAGRIRSSEHSSCSAARVPHGTGQPGNTQPDQLSPGYHHIPNRYGNLSVKNWLWGPRKA